MLRHTLLSLSAAHALLELPHLREEPTETKIAGFLKRCGPDSSMLMSVVAQHGGIKPAARAVHAAVMALQTKTLNPAERKWLGRHEAHLKRGLDRFKDVTDQTAAALLGELCDSAFVTKIERKQLERLLESAQKEPAGFPLAEFRKIRTSAEVATGPGDQAAFLRALNAASVDALPVLEPIAVYLRRHPDVLDHWAPVFRRASLLDPDLAQPPVDSRPLSVFLDEWVPLCAGKKSPLQVAHLWDILYYGFHQQHPGCQSLVSEHSPNSLRVPALTALQSGLRNRAHVDPSVLRLLELAKSNPGHLERFLDRSIG